LIAPQTTAAPSRVQRFFESFVRENRKQIVDDHFRFFVGEQACVIGFLHGDHIAPIAYIDLEGIDSFPQRKNGTL
jgi:hypothetical protein